MSAFDGNYDPGSILISVDPTAIINATAQVTSTSDSVNASLTHILTTLNGLELSWVGPSATLAQQYADAWNAAMIQLFGTENDPGWGSLNQLMAAVTAAGSNYSQVEGGLAADFNNIYGKLTAPPGNPGATPQSQAGPPISETY